MNTKEVCEQLAVTPKMLRIYEKQELIHAEREANNYRNYAIDDILRIKIIVTLRSLGFSLKEIKAILDFKKPSNYYLYSFYIQYKAIESKIYKLNNDRMKLSATINEILQSKENDTKPVNTILASLNTDNEKTTYEEMINCWNFDNMASDYVNRYLKKDKGYLNTIRKIQEMILSLPHNKTYLDIGAGTCQLWTGIPDSYKLTAIDNSLQMILKAKKNVPYAIYILEDILLIDTGQFEKFDYVISTFTIHHIPYEQQKKALKNIIDLCRKGGRIIIADRSFNNAEDRSAYEKKLIEEGNTEYLEVINSEFYLIAEDILNYISGLGFTAECFPLEENIKGFIIDK